MTYPPQQQYPSSPTPPPPPAAPRRQWWKSLWFVGLVALIVGIGIGAGSGSSSKNKTASNTTTTVSNTVTATATTTADAPTVTATVTGHPTQVVATHTKTVRVTYTPPEKPAINDGVYQVGRDVAAGRFRTKGGNDCYFAVYSDPNGNNIIANGDSTGPQIVDARDGQYLNFSGGCEWHHD